MSYRNRLVCLVIGMISWWDGPLQAQGYTVSPTVPDFTDFTASCAVATYGTTLNPFEYTGVVQGRHTLINQAGTDMYTGGLLSYLPGGVSKVVRLGNPEAGGEAESITYHFLVDPDKAVLLLKFAVVFQDPSHPHIAQPRFIVRIMNAAGDLIESCAEYDVSARPDIDGFQTDDRWGVPIRWRDWTSVGLDMSSYAGQEVQVQFVTYDCDYQGHFGYAYFTASCVSHQLAMKNCSGDRFTIDAPLGFESYLWQDGRTISSTDWTHRGEDMNLSCDITSATGCRFTLSAMITSGDKIPVEKEFKDTVCQGDVYARYNYNLSEQRDAGTFLYYNTYFDPARCASDGVTTLALTVLPRYYPIEAELCPGESYRENGFNYEHPAPGEYRDTIWYHTDSPCDSAVVLHLTVFPEITMTGNIVGEKQPCVGSVEVYSISENWESGSYSWDFPEGFYVLEGQGTTRVKVQVTDGAEHGKVTLLFGAAGCATGTEPFVIMPNKSYWLTLTDTLCTGIEYREKGFAVPAQDSAGIHTFMQYKKTVSGCDSIVTLALSVFETPAIHIKTLDSVVCPGEFVHLHALNDSSRIVTFVSPAVAIGDVLCTDGTTVKAAEYKTSGKQALGIVFWVDETAEHGWAVHLQNQSENCTWSLEYADITGLQNYTEYYTAVLDTSGYINTQIIRAYGNRNRYEAAYLVDFSKGWYLPALGQLMQLYAALPEVNEGLKITGGSIISFQTADEWSYWASTEFQYDGAWALLVRGKEAGSYKNSIRKLRSVRSF